MSNSSGWDALETVNIQNGKLNKEVKELKQTIKTLKKRLKDRNLTIEELSHDLTKSWFSTIFNNE